VPSFSHAGGEHFPCRIAQSLDGMLECWCYTDGSDRCGFGREDLSDASLNIHGASGISTAERRGGGIGWTATPGVIRGRATYTAPASSTRPESVALECE
jgi:hypothetical protein